MMSCHFERLQFLEYYQEKKSSSLSSAAVEVSWEEGRVSEQPGSAACRQTPLTPGFLHILGPRKHSRPERSLSAVSSPDHKNSKIISSLQPQR